MHPAGPFRDAVHAWTDLIARADALDPDMRIEALTAHIAHLYTLGLRLPPAEPTRPPAEPSPWPESWPGLGTLDDQAPPLTMLLRGLTSDLTRGLDAEEDAAAAWWRRSFDARWGTLATAILSRLHGRLVERRTLPTPTVQPPTPQPGQTPAEPPSPPGPALVQRGPGTILPGLEPAKPTRQRIQRARLSSGGPAGVLGMRFERMAGELVITAVHPTGPAAERLLRGDVLLAIDGLPLRGRDDEAVRAALVGPAGVARELTIARASEIVALSLTPVEPESLAPPPLSLDLLVFDGDAFATLAGKLEALEVELTPDPDQPGQVHVSGPASIGRVVLGLVQLGEESGYWERLS